MSEIIAINNPFKRSQRQIIKIEPGSTITEIVKRDEVIGILGDCELTAAVNGNIIPISAWDTYRVHQNDYLVLAPKVAGGDDGKMILNIVLMIIIYAVAGPAAGALFAEGTAIYTIAYVAFIVGGAMLLSSLQPHPDKPTPAFLDEEMSQIFGWNPTTIQRQGIPVPRFYGRNQLYGNVIGAYTEKEADSWVMTTITEVFYYNIYGQRLNKWEVGAHQRGTNTQSLTSFDPRKVRLSALFCLGMGPMREPIIDGTLKLNDQDVNNLSSVLSEDRPGDIIQQPISYFNNTKLEVVVSRLVTNGLPVTYTTTNGNFNNLKIVLSFPNGLYNATGGDLANYSVNVTVEIKKTTDTVWTKLVDNVAITAAVGDKIIETYETEGNIAIEYGFNYDIRTTKETAEQNNIKYGDKLYLDKVREVIEHQFTYPRRAVVGIDALATDQLSGSIRFSVQSRGLYVRVYDGASWNIQYSNNPAWVINDILTQPVFTGNQSPWIDLKLLLNFEDADGAVTTVDSSPKGHTIIFNGGSEIDTDQQKFGAAALFTDGVDGDIQIANDNESFSFFSNLVENWTLGIELRLADHTGVEIICGQFEDANNYWYIFHQDGAGFTFRLRTNATLHIDITGIGEISDVDWYHIALIKVGPVIGFYKAGTQIGYALMDADMVKVFASDFYIGQDGDGNSYTHAWYDHIRIEKDNIFAAAPNSTPDDTITEPAGAWTDPGNSYAVARYDGYDTSKISTADLEDLADWCNKAQVNPINVGIASISLATQALITTTTIHNRIVGDVVLFRGAGQHGMVELLDGTTATIVSVTSDLIFTVDIDTSGYTAFDATHWYGIDSANKESVCGEDKEWTLSRALRISHIGFHGWLHEVDEIHNFVIDLEQIYTILKIRSRSNSTADPIDVDVFISDDAATWGAAVASGISTWQDTGSWVEVDITDKAGRYIKFVINDTEDANNYIHWASGLDLPILDAQVLESSATVEEYKPRFEFNGGFDTEKNMWAAVLSVCELCRCIPYWDGDTIRIAIDKSAEPVYAFTMGNILKGSYREIWIPIAERASEIEIHYRDATKNYQRQPFTIINPSITSTTSKTRLDLFGITDSDMANRLTTYKLLLNQHIKKMCMFDADVEAIACAIGDVVEVQHDVTNWGQIGSGSEFYTGGGRVIKATNVTNAVISIAGKIKFDDADFDGGVTSYKLMIKDNTDAEPEALTITALVASSVNGADFDITVAGTYAATPKKDDVWAAGQADYETQQFRIINLRQKANQQVEVTALQYVEAVYANDSSSSSSSSSSS